jgi:hypothetical protein
MNKLLPYLALLLAVSFGCTSGTKPVETPDEDIVIVDGSEPTEKPVEQPAQVTAASVLPIERIAAESSCRNVSWAGHGKLPVGYYKGLALAFGKAACRVKDKDDAFGQIMNQPLKSASKDALAHYGVSAGIKNLFTLMLGLGVRESDGRFWIGRDTTATNTTSVTAEAGEFQTSYNSVSAHSQLPKLMQYYQANPGKCQKAAFSEGYSVGSSSNFGSGLGLEFQKLSKSCPMFGAEWAGVILRNLKSHYGPILRKEAQFKSECSSMLAQVQTYIDQNPSVCGVL